MLWYPLSAAGQIEVTVLALESLLPLNGETGNPTVSETSAAAAFTSSAVRASQRIPQGLPPGRHLVRRIDGADTLDEVIMLADGPPARDEVCSPTTAIYVWQPRTGSVEVLVQKWMTADDLDLGYQWLPAWRVIPLPVISWAAASASASSS